MRTLEICMDCRFREQGTGRLKCTQSNELIVDHAKAGNCPKGFHADVPLPVYEPPVRRPAPLPIGDWVAELASFIGADRLASLWEKWTRKSCGCGDRQKWLNDKGEHLHQLWLKYKSLKSILGKWKS